jgi:peptidoglycan/LPS O-acetylase OafA/YrhL
MVSVLHLITNEKVCFRHKKIENHETNHYMQFISARKNFKNIFFRTSDRFTSLDGFRAFSIMAVIIFHSFFFLQKVINGEIKDFDERLIFLKKVPVFFNWVWQADKGVDIFFILSGFLIGHKLFREHQKNGVINLKRFYYQRLLRIVPVYVVALLIALIFIRNNAEYIWANILFINNFVSVDKLYLQHSWSITVEMQFYFIFPLFFVYIFNKTKHQLCILILFFITASIIRFGLLMFEPNLYSIPLYNIFFQFDEQTLNRLAEVLYGNTYTRCGPIILGILAAYLYVHHQNVIEKWIQKNVNFYNLIIILSVMLTIYGVSKPVHDPSADFNQNVSIPDYIFFLTTNRNIFSLGMTVIIFSSLFPFGLGRQIHSFFSLRIFYPIAELSYSIYLFHVPIIVGAGILVLGIFDPKNVDVNLVISNLTVAKVFMIAFLTLIISAVLSVFVYVLVERPFMSLYRIERN